MISKSSIQCVILVIIYKDVIKVRKAADYLDTCTMVKLLFQLKTSFSHKSHLDEVLTGQGR